MANKVILTGNVGKNPESRDVNGTLVSSFSVATTERWKDKQGNKQEKTEWHRIVAWGPLANICDQYLKKGSKIYIEGKLQTRKWNDQNGVERYVTEVIAREMEMLGGNNGNSSSGSNGNSRSPNTRSNNNESLPPQGYSGDGYPGGYDDSDVPF